MGNWGLIAHGIPREKENLCTRAVIFGLFKGKKAGTNNIPSACH